MQGWSNRILTIIAVVVGALGLVAVGFFIFLVIAFQNFGSNK